MKHNKLQIVTLKNCDLDILDHLFQIMCYGSPGGGSGCGQECGCGHHVIPGDTSLPKPQIMGSATKGQPQQEWTVQRMQGALDLYKRR